VPETEAGGRYGFQGSCDPDKGRGMNSVGAWKKEYLRPWKLISLGLGLLLLIIGSFYYEAPDWDIPISFIMAFFAYATAPWSLRVIVERRWKSLPLALLYTWFTVDGCYWLYWHFKDPRALELMRSANFPASLSLYGMCGLVWYYRGTLREFMVEARNIISPRRRR
jgi:hypothetical protein